MIVHQIEEQTILVFDIDPITLERRSGLLASRFNQEGDVIESVIKGNAYRFLEFIYENYIDDILTHSDINFVTEVEGLYVPYNSNLITGIDPYTDEIKRVAIKKDLKGNYPRIYLVEVYQRLGIDLEQFDSFLNSGCSYKIINVEHIDPVKLFYAY